MKNKIGIGTCFVIIIMNLALPLRSAENLGNVLSVPQLKAGEVGGTGYTLQQLPNGQTIATAPDGKAVIGSYLTANDLQVEGAAIGDIQDGGEEADGEPQASIDE